MITTVKMARYGVKMKTGKVLWILADDLEVKEGMLLFRRNGEKPNVIAGFNVSLVDHFGIPDAFAKESGDTKPE